MGNPKPSPKPVFKMANIARALNFTYRLAVPATVGAFLTSQAIYDVKGGTRAVIFDRLSGVKEDVINEGTHFLVPWLQRSIILCAHQAKEYLNDDRQQGSADGQLDAPCVASTKRASAPP